MSGPHFGYHVLDVIGFSMHGFQNVQRLGVKSEQNQKVSLFSPYLGTANYGTGFRPRGMLYQLC